MKIACPKEKWHQYLIKNEAFKPKISKDGRWGSRGYLRNWNLENHLKMGFRKNYLKKMRFEKLFLKSKRKKMKVTRGLKKKKKSCMPKVAMQLEVYNGGPREE